MSGSATFTIVTSMSSMNVPRHTVISGSHLRIGISSSPLRTSLLDATDKSGPDRHLGVDFRHDCSGNADPLVLDLVDRQILRSLQLNPRAPFRRVAAGLAVLGADRRAALPALHAAGRLRVVAAVDPRALGESDWIVRVRTRPEATMDIGRALCRRDDIAWVSIGAGVGDRLRACARTTRATAKVCSSTGCRASAPCSTCRASVVLRHFVGGSASDWVGLSEVLTAEQEAAVATPSDAPGRAAPSCALDRADYAMLEILARDGRAGYGELARAAGLSEGRATRRLAALLEQRRRLFRRGRRGAALGFPVSAYIWLTVAPAQLDAACLALSTHPEAPFVAAVSGRANVVVSVTCRDLDELYGYMTARLGVIDGVQAVEIAPVLRRLKQAGAMVDGDRLAVR